LGFLDHIRRVNNGVCPWWMCYSFDNPLRRLFHDPELLLAPYVKPGAIAADIGCGMGYFTIGMARLAGPAGRVIAVDLQQQMLDLLQRRASEAGVAGRIVLNRCGPDSLGIGEPVDCALSFWMAHEVPDKPHFFREILSALKPGGTLLLAEPKFHVWRKSFERTAAVCREQGFRILGEPAIPLSRAVLMGKEQ